ncbi:MAG: OmpH family outer membrane protein [Candidatus Kapabacteria bacterium]|nr:OmpH family outer membrane protein [Ignavibacteriota bacterium]MCW5883544.1 OmpH family outer membrane protein [Candidatus Kapabacteria bacterium]
MNKLKFYLPIIFMSAILMLTVSENSYSQAGNKLGVVDVESVLKELPDAIDADRLIKDKGQKWQDTLLKMRSDLTAKIEQYQKQKSMMPQDKQQVEEESLQNQNMIMMQYQEEKFGQQGELNKFREELLEPIRNKIRKAIEKVAKEEKIMLVVDKMAAIYSDQSIDITFRVIDSIKRGGNN